MGHHCWIGRRRKHRSWAFLATTLLLGFSGQSFGQQTPPQALASIQAYCDVLQFRITTTDDDITLLCRADTQADMCQEARRDRANAVASHQDCLQRLDLARRDQQHSERTPTVAVTPPSRPDQPRREAQLLRREARQLALIRRRAAQEAAQAQAQINQVTREAIRRNRIGSNPTVPAALSGRAPQNTQLANASGSDGATPPPPDITPQPDVARQEPTTYQGSTDIARLSNNSGDLGLFRPGRLIAAPVNSSGVVNQTAMNVPGVTAAAPPQLSPVAATGNDLIPISNFITESQTHERREFGGCLTLAMVSACYLGMTTTAEGQQLFACEGRINPEIRAEESRYYSFMRRNAISLQQALRGTSEPSSGDLTPSDRAHRLVWQDTNRLMQQRAALARALLDGYRNISDPGRRAAAAQRLPLLLREIRDTLGRIRTNGSYTFPEAWFNQGVGYARAAGAPPPYSPGTIPFQRPLEERCAASAAADQARATTGTRGVDTASRDPRHGDPAPAGDAALRLPAENNGASVAQ